MMKAVIKNNAMPMIMLLMITMINTGITAGFLVLREATIPHLQIYLLAILEIALLVLTIRHIKPESENLPL